jgi:U3 small nucleolar RNA-associated protein 11
VLKTKAAYRNPDEFYFSMEKSRTKDGVHVGRREESNKYSTEELHLMKTQDVKYVGLRASMEMKKVEKLRATLHMIGGTSGDGEDDDGGGFGGLGDDGFDAMEAFAPRGSGTQRKKHTIFVDSEREARAFDAAGHFGTDPEEDIHAKAYNRRRVLAGAGAAAGSEGDGSAKRVSALAAKAAGQGLGLRRGLLRAAAEDEARGVAPRGAAVATAVAAAADPQLAKKIEKKRRVAYALLAEREARAGRLKAMTAEMAMQKEISHSKGHKRKLQAAREEEDDTPEGLRHLKKEAAAFKWKKERKR